MKKSTAFAKKQITMLTLVLALALAVYLNWRLAGNGDDLKLTEVISNENAVSQTEIVSDDVFTEADGDESAEETAEYYGEALFVSAPSETSDEYFSEARMTRTKTRDEALDALQKSLQKTELTDAEKKSLTAQLTEIATNITKEGTIESLVKAKGFTDCVAFINNGKVKVVVKTAAGTLTTAEVSQVKEIVISECGTSPSDISIVEIK
ncbi:MAG: SpoIIIAH-like family protein [Ruminococcaceae bacterium]|nr:SpoIIIAH-like family protein [Oscillospiraceae bacterium]